MTVRVALAATIAAGLAMMVGLFVATLEGEPGIVDTPVYRLYGERITDGSLPYSDFDVEYPPGSLVAFVIPALLSSTPSGYDTIFQTLMILALAVASALVVVALGALGASTGRTALAVGAFWAGIALLGPFLLTRFDIFAAAVTLGAVCAILHRRRVLGPVLLGLAIATKIYPAVLVPLLVARAAREGGRAAAVRALVLSLGTALLVYLPFLVVAPTGVGHSVWRQVGRPLQIESLGASVLLALHHAFGMGLGWASGSGSQNLTGTVASVASIGSTLLGAAALVLVWLRFARGDAGNEAVRALCGRGRGRLRRLREGRLAAVPRLDPRRVVLVAGPRGIVAMALVAAACGVTRLWFPRSYWELVKAVRPDVVVAAAPARPPARRSLRHPRDARPPALEPELTNGSYGQGTRTGLIAVARPVCASHSTSAPSIRTPPSATSNRTGMPVRMRWVACSALTPMTESCGPVMPASVIAAVPPGWTRASEVWTCVCVPITAVTRPSSQRASATFSLVASAWTSTITTGVDSRGLVDEAVDELPHAPRGLQRERAHHVDDADPGAVRRGHDREPAARGGGGEVRRPHDSVRAREVRADLRPPPGVVAEGDRVGAGGEKPLGQLRRDPDAVGDVLAVDDADVDVELLAQRAEAVLERVASRASDDVSDEEDVQGSDPAAGWTSMATLLPPARACSASACRSTTATSTTVPSFDDEASTGLPTASDGSGSRWFSVTMRDGAALGRTSMREP